MSPVKAAFLEAGTLVGSIVEASQLDNAYTSAASLIEQSQAGEIDLILENPHKSAKQKALFLDKVLDTVSSPELRKALEAGLGDASLSPYLSKNLIPYLHNVREYIDQVEVIDLTVAVLFQPEDLRDMAEVASKRIGKPVAFDLKIEKGLIGGAVIQYGHYLSDYSLKTRLDQFRETWHKAVVKEV